ncbi:unnamed protein product [Colletotrichum noveboracense]|uniref:Xylanolytic transcriptional activator regulatory domain-containing protein n=1 Tax=Colletotrichum noveboracense TaxID=2664923 RepID=A0A9W4RMG1_9PEZI|nr:unnamed protein product [Colletotrichum noveboracense]
MREPENEASRSPNTNQRHETYTPQTNATSDSAHGPSNDGSRATAATEPDGEGSLWFQVGIGEDGAVIYNGPTSRFHAGALEEDNLNEVSDPLPLIAAKPGMNGTGVDATTGMALLDIYWSWLHPLHSCVYRPILMMDLALGGSYCSDFLLLCIFGLAARHLPEESSDNSGVSKGERFIARARELLLQEMAATKPAIPTIQGLLILGGRQCASGKSSEGWLYTGMAIRMMKDIGLHLDITKLSRLERWTPAEIETRKRLYNSAYIWDKTLSLALGRPPSLTRRPHPAQEILDKVDDQRLWKPVHATEVSENYVLLPSWTTSTFCAFCHLHEITTSMMLLFSSVTKNDEFASQIADIDSKIHQWYDSMPAALKIEDISGLRQSPPPHIVSLNLLYHALHILLRRPYLSSSDKDLKERSMKVCIEHSKKIHAIHSLYSQTFPHRLMTYQVSYCIYTAATVETEELKRATTQQDREDAAARLAAAFRILQKEASHTPGSGRSLDTIRRLLSTGQPSRNGGHENTPMPRNHVQHTNQRQLRTINTENNGGGFANGTGGSMGSVPGSYSVSADSSATNNNNSLFPAADGGVWSDDIAYGGTDTGAGFHPDAFPWGVAGLSTFSGTGMLWPSLSNTEGFQ